MNIGIVCGAGMLSGKEIMALELGAGLRDQGQQVVFVTSLWGDGKFRQRLNEGRFDTRCMRLGFISATLRWDCIRMSLDQLARVPGLWRGYAAFLREDRPAQVIHTNWHHLMMLWPFLKPARDWFWLHEVVPDKPQYRTVFQRLSRRLRGFIPVSQAVRESLLRIDIPDRQIHVIHNGLADPQVGGGNARRSWQGVRLGIVGQVAPWKGHEDLLEAFARVAVTHKEAELHVFGQGGDEFIAHLQQRARESGIDSRLEWRGFVADRRDIFDEVDVCVVPSRTPDPLPTVAIEAAFFALPVVASRIGGLPEIIEDGSTGLLHAAGDVTELAQCLDRLLTDGVLRQDMGGRARLRAVGHFSRERFVAEFARLINPPETNVS